jgi:hypothetical protein
MTVASLKIGKREFVVIPKREYERFQKWCDTTKGGRKRLSDEDRADLAIALKRLNDPSEKRIRWSQVKNQQGS